jgi:AcrR family transcriptional regulator
MNNQRAELPRQPLRSRGRSRYGALLDAADKLLVDRPPALISLQDVARQAKAPLASVYHYFPSSAAIFVGLAERYHVMFEALYDEPVSRVPPTWPELSRLLARRSRALYDRHPTTMRLFLGADIGGKIREVDLDANRRLGERQYKLIRENFLVPDEAELIDKFAIAVTLSDAIWSLSYIRHGRITEELAEEAALAKENYLASYIPLRARRRSHRK